MPQIIMHTLRALIEPDNFNFVSYELPRTTLVRFYLLSNGVQNQVHSPFHSPGFVPNTSLCLGHASFMHKHHDYLDKMLFEHNHTSRCSQEVSAAGC